MVDAGNKWVNTPDTDTSLELIKDLREYFGSCMPRNKWYKEKFCSYLQAPYFQVGNENINFFLIEYLDVSTRFMKIWITKHIYIFISVYVFKNLCKLLDQIWAAVFI